MDDRRTDRQGRTGDSQKDGLLTMDNKQRTVNGRQTDKVELTTVKKLEWTADSGQQTKNC